MTAASKPPASPSSRPPIWRRRWAQLVGAVVLALLVLVAVFDWNWFRGPLERHLSESSGRPVTIGQLDVKLFKGPRVIVDNIAIGNAPWAGDKPLARLRRLVIDVSLLSLLTDEVVIKYLGLTDGEVNLVRDKDGRANWRLRQKDAEPPERTVHVQALMLEDASLSLRDAIQDVNLDASGVTRVEGPYRTRMTFKGRWRGNPFEGFADTGDVLALRDIKDPFPLRVSLRFSRTSIDAEGQVANLRTLSSIDAKVTAVGPSLASLYPTLPVALPDTPPYRISGRLIRDGETYTYENFSGVIGNTDLSGTARFERRRPRPMLTATLKSRSLDLADLGPLVGLERRQPGAEPASSGAKTTPAKLPTGKVFPQKEFNLEKLNAMNADVRLDAARLKIPDQIPLEDFHTHLKLNEGVLVLDPLNFGMAGGDLVSTITLDARNNPINAKASIDLRKIQLGKLLPTIENVKHTSTGSLGAQIRLTGRGNSVARMLATADGSIHLGMAGGRVSELGVWLVNLHAGELLPLLFGGDRPTQIRCAASAVAVDDGIGTIQFFLFDTDESRINGAGAIDLREERLDVTLDPKPKKPGILSFRGPIRIHGTFRDTDFAVSPQTIGRGVSAIALGIVNPLLALLPLVETGPGQSADCQGLLANVTGAVKQSGKKPSDAPEPEVTKREQPAPIVEVPTKRDGPQAPIVDVPPKKGRS